MSKTKYTRERLAPLVAASTSYTEVIRKLGMNVNGGNHRLISARIRHFELDTAHFGSRIRERIDAIPEAALRTDVASALSFADVLARHDLPTRGRTHHELKRRIAHLALDVSHFRGQAWNRGETTWTHGAVARGSRKRRLSDDEVFVENSKYVNSGAGIIKRLRERGWPYACSECGLSTWQGKPLSLHLDHINGIHNDNRLKNVRLLCPNCHSQTTTYCQRWSSVPRAREPRANDSCYTRRPMRAWRNWYPRQT